MRLQVNFVDFLDGWTVPPVRPCPPFHALHGSSMAPPTSLSPHLFALFSPWVTSSFLDIP